MAAPSNIARGRTFDPARTRWQLMFATDSTESVVRNGEQVDTVFGEDVLRAIVANRKREITINARRGTVMQPKPVSIQHAIARRLFLGEQVADADAQRIGNDFDLHYHDGSTGDPAGTYALVEWTRDEWDGIEDGGNMTLSPTSVRDYSMTDGTVLRGLSLQEIGRVDVPQLDSIGTTRDGLPWDAFGEDATDARPRAAAEPRYRTPIWRDAAPLSQVVMRSAIIVDGAEPTATPDEELMFTDEQKAELAEMFGALESKLLDAMRTEMAAAAPDDVPPEDVDARAAAPDTATPAEPPAEPTVDEIEDAQIDAEIRSMVASRTLLASRVPAVRLRMKAGEDIGDLVGNYAAAELRSRAPQGAPTATGGDDGTPSVVMYSRVVADAEATVPAQAGGRRNAIALNDAIKARTSELRAKGVTINMEG